MQYLGFALLVLLFLEIISIIMVSKIVGGLATLVLMILFFMAGSFLMKRSAGVSKLMLAAGMFRNGGQLSPYQMLYPIRVPFAACLLMFPGFFSDIIALLLLLPFGSATASNSHSSQTDFAGFGQHTQQHYRRNVDDDDVIEGDYVVHDKRKRP